MICTHTDSVVKVFILIINIALYCSVIWVWTPNRKTTTLFFYSVLLVLALSFMGYLMERAGIQYGFPLSLLRARLIDAPLLPGMFLIAEYMLAGNKKKFPVKQ